MADGIRATEAVTTLDAGEPRPGDATRASANVALTRFVGLGRMLLGASLTTVGLILGPTIPGFAAAVLGSALFLSGGAQLITGKWHGVEMKSVE